MSKQATIVFNPIAGQAGVLEQELKSAAQVLRDEGWQVQLCSTHGPADATRIAREAAAAACDVVIAAGGDGTINEVVNGLAGTKTALATLPLGTVNVWARELGLPLHPCQAARTLLSWKPRAIDLGRAGDRYFLLMAGIGFDAQVTAGVRAQDKQRLGVLAYVLSVLSSMINLRGTRAVLTLDGRRVKGRVLLVVIGNSQLYGGIVKVTHRATIDDGLLDICIIKGNGLLSGLLQMFTLLRRRYSVNPEIEYYRARTIHVTARTALPLQVDGDTIGYTPIRIDVAPGALQALMPNDLPDDFVRRV